MEGSSERHVGDVVGRLIDSLGLTDRDGVIPLVARWRSLVGVDLAAHSYVLNVEHGVVFVGVDHPAWLQRLQWKQDSIVRTIRTTYPELAIQRLAFSIVSQGPRPVERSGHTGAGQRTTASADRSGAEGSDPKTDEQSAAVPPVSRHQARENTPRAEEDRDLQKSLEALKRALAERDDID